MFMYIENLHFNIYIIIMKSNDIKTEYWRERQYGCDLATIVTLEDRLTSALDQMEKEIETLREDKKILDWLFKDNFQYIKLYRPGWVKPSSITYKSKEDIIRSIEKEEH